MNKQRLSGVILITGFIVLILGGFIYTPPNLYQEKDIDVRMQLVEDYRSEFNNAQIAAVVGATMMAVGFLALSLHLGGDQTARLANFGAAAMLLATISLVILKLGGISDARAYLDRSSMQGTSLLIFGYGYTWLTIAAYLLYGIVFLRADFPKWLAYFTLGFASLVLVVALFIETAAVELLFLMPLVVGIVLLRRSKAIKEVINFQ